MNERPPQSPATSRSASSRARWVLAVAAVTALGACGAVGNNDGDAAENNEVEIGGMLLLRGSSATSPPNEGVAPGFEPPNEGESENPPPEQPGDKEEPQEAPAITQVTVRADGVPLTVTSVRITPSDSGFVITKNTCEHPLGDGDSCRLRLTLEPGRSLPERATLTVGAVAPDGSPREQELELVTDSTLDVEVPPAQP